VNYESPEVYRGSVKTEIQEVSHSGGILKMRVFKILNNNKKGGDVSGDSESANGIGGNSKISGSRNIKALIDETNK